jgi:hypothetical protein
LIGGAWKHYSVRRPVVFAALPTGILLIISGTTPTHGTVLGAVIASIAILIHSVFPERKLAKIGTPIALLLTAAALIPEPWERVAQKIQELRKHNGEQTAQLLSRPLTLEDPYPVHRTLRKTLRDFEWWDFAYPLVSKQIQLYPNVKYIRYALTAPVWEHPWSDKERDRIFAFSEKFPLFRCVTPETDSIQWKSKDPPPTGVTGSIPEVTVHHFNPNSMDVTIAAKAPCMLVWADAVHPAWRARVDGVPRTIHTANGLMKALWIDKPGSSHVRFDFVPVGFLLTFFSGWVGLLGLSYLATRRT